MEYVTTLWTLDVFYILREGEGGRLVGCRVVEWFRVRTDPNVGVLVLVY
jgi:hypothetical protein